MSTVTQTPTPKIPASFAKRSFVGYYRHRNTPPVPIFFEYQGDLKMARERFKKHCEVMGYLYLQVVPMLMDLDKREQRRHETDNDFSIDD